MTKNAHHRQLGKFVILFQELVSSLVEFISVIADDDYTAEILPAETEYPRLVESTDATFSRFMDRLYEPDVEARVRFHQLMVECLDIGVLRNRLVRSTYALLERRGDVVGPGQDRLKLRCKDSSRRQTFAQDPPVESFEPYFRQIAKALAELESFRLRFSGEIDAVAAAGRAC